MSKLHEDCASHLRKKQLAKLAEDTIGHTPVSFLMEMMITADLDAKTRVDAAKALLPYFHSKKPVESIITSVNEITTIERKII